MAGKKATKDPASASIQELLWLDAFDRRLTIRGLAWLKENGKRFSRFPLRAQKLVRPPVWELAQCPASVRVCFRSDTTRLSVRVTNATLPKHAHFPLTGSAGVALYVGEPYRSVPWAFGVPDFDNPSFERALFSGVSKKMREFTLFLPLYAPLEKLALGFSPDAKIERPAPAALAKPVVFYGTSITQGGCASTVAFDFVSTLSRLLNIDVVNLGFSGNGQGEPEVARLIAEIAAAGFVLDYVANVDPARLKKTLPVFCRILRAAHPTTPIILLSKLCYAGASFSSEARSYHETMRDIMIHFYSKQRKAGDVNLHFVDGSALISFGSDATQVDGGHPADHGFRLMAERLAPFLRGILLADG